jgi:hypothetical protein
MKLDHETLAAGLGVAAIVERSELPAAGRADCEIVTCRMGDGSPRRLFCKFGPLAEPAPPARCFGVGYEAQVYDQLLPAWPDDVPRLHGALLDEPTQTVGLALECLDSATLLQDLPQPKAGLTAAARWIGRFHRWSETVAVPTFLHRYDTEFYRAWMQRAGHFTRHLHERFPWLPDLCERCQRRLPALLPPATIIHGGYRAENILLRDSRAVAIDWESAALAAGEIDLASLTWGWGDELAALCRQQYGLARWPDGAPDDFDLRLTAARVFLHLQRLGDVDEGEDEGELLETIGELSPLAENLTALER